MANTVIKIPALPSSLTLTIDVRHPTTLAVLETVAMTHSAGVFSGDVTGPHAGKLLFILLASGVPFGHRVRTIADDVGPYILVSEFETSVNDGLGQNLTTITVTDGGLPVEGVVVRVSGNGVNASQTTVVNGIAKFALSNGTYDVTLAKAGYETSVETLVVSGVTADSYDINLLNITVPSDPTLATGYIVVYDELSVPENAVPITVTLVAGKDVDGYSYDLKPVTLNTNSDGFVEFTHLVRGLTYSISRGGTETPAANNGFASVGASSSGIQFVVPDQPTFPLPETLGTDVEA